VGPALVPPGIRLALRVLILAVMPTRHRPGGWAEAVEALASTPRSVAPIPPAARSSQPRSAKPR
jgi:hypothetical protein